MEIIIIIIIPKNSILEIVLFFGNFAKMNPKKIDVIP